MANNRQEIKKRKSQLKEQQKLLLERNVWIGLFVLTLAGIVYMGMRF